MPAIFMLFGFLITFMVRGFFFLWGVDSDVIAAKYLTQTSMLILILGLYIAIGLDILHTSENKTLARFITNPFKLSLVFLFWPLFMPVLWAINTTNKLATKYYR